MRLLPKDQDWTAYTYLIYLVYFAATPFLFPMQGWQRGATFALAVLVIPLYLSGYWLRGPKVLWVVGTFFVLGTALCGTNPAASVFFVYAASFLGKAFEPKVAYRWLVALLLGIGLDTWILNFSIYAWMPAAVFSALVGSIVIQQFSKKRLTERLLRAQEEVEQMAKVAERERIARDLHDLLGHTLSLIVLKSELASRLMPTDTAKAASEIRDVERISREALSEVRAAVRGYRSAGFDSELRAARDTLETAGVTVEANVEQPTLSATQESVMALALREAVTNVVRHAHATSCRLSLRRNGAYCELEVADNGRGGTGQEGSGLIGMRQRVEALGGALERDGSQGTRLLVRVPV